MTRVVTRARMLACGLACATLLSSAAPAEPPPTKIAPVIAAPTLDARLCALTVTDDDFYRPVLYTWTTPAAAASLRARRQLLVATASTGAFISPFNRALATVASHARAGSPGRAIAHLLATHPALVRRRYAWPAPFATVLGLGAHAYGNALVRIELRPDAWIGRFDPDAREPFAFVDGAGAAIADADVLAHPERIGAIFHVRAGSDVSPRFREYVVCNAGMVASWSIATPAIRAELDAEAALLAELRAPWSQLAHADAIARAAPAWSHAQTSAPLVELWHAALAFDNARYRPDAHALAALAAALAAYDDTGAPLVVDKP